MVPIHLVLSYNTLFMYFLTIFGRILPFWSYSNQKQPDDFLQKSSLTSVQTKPYVQDRN